MMEQISKSSIALQKKIKFQKCLYKNQKKKTKKRQSKKCDRQSKLNKELQKRTKNRIKYKEDSCKFNIDNN